MKMKRIIAILLAVCFVMSVTVAAVSAHEDHKEKHEHKEKCHWELIKEKHVKWNHGHKEVFFTKEWKKGFRCKNNFVAFLGYNYCFLYHY